ncbi:MAG: hypothetical protein QW253_00040 [Metallosphaera sp.]
MGTIITIYLKDDVYELLKKEAEKNKVSLNKQASIIITRSLRRKKS